MTPLTVKERIDASLVGGVEYKGTFNATAGTPSLLNAEQGDLYVIDVAGTIYGQDWSIGDQLLINADMGGTISNGKINKVDNTDTPASETVAGVIEIATDAEAGAGTETDKALVPSNVSSLSIASSQVTGLATVATSGAYADISGTPTLATVATTGAYADVTGTPTLATVATTGAYADVTGTPTLATVATTGAYADVTGTPTLGTAAAQDVGEDANDVVQLDASARLPAVDGSQLTNLPSGATQLNDLSDVTITGASTGEVLRYSGAAWVDATLAYADISGTPTLATVATTGAYADVTGTPTLATVATTGAYADVTGTPTLATVATTGAYADVTGTPTLATVATTGAYADVTGTPDLSIYAPLASPALSGSPTAPTQTQSDGSDKLATTSYVDTAVSGSANPTLDGVTTNGNTTTNAINVGTVTTSGNLLADVDATRTIGAEDTRFITTHSDLNGAVRFKAKNDQGSAITKGQVVYIKGVSGTVPTVGLAKADSASTMPAFGLALANANDQAEVQIVTFGNLTDYDTTTYSLSANDTVFVSAATAGALTNSAPSGEANLIQNIGRVVRADSSAGIIKVGGAGRSAATPNLDEDKIFVGNASNQAVSTALSAIDLSSFNNDLPSGVTQLNDLSDVSITGAATGEVLRYSGATWVDAQLAYADLSGTPTLATVATTGDYADVLNTPDLSIYAPLASPALTGTPTAPTQTQSDGSDKLATTSYVDTAVAAGGGGGVTYSAITADPSPAVTGYHYSCTGSFTITIPTSQTAGSSINIKNMGTGTITLDPQGSNIDGSSTDYTMDVQFGALTLVSDGTGWEII